MSWVTWEPKSTIKTLSCMDGVCPNLSGIGRLNAVRAGFVRALDFRVKPFGSYPPPNDARSAPRVVDHGAQQRNLRYPFAGV